MANFIEQIQKINALAAELVRQGKAKDSEEANKMAEEMICGKELGDFNKNANKTVEEFQSYGDRVRKNGMKQPK